MSLHANTMNRNTLFLQVLHHVVDAFTLARVALIIIVVEEQSLRISLMCKLKSIADESIFSAKFLNTVLIVNRLTERRLSRTTTESRTLLIGHSLIDDIPAVNDVLISIYNGSNMILETSEEDLFLNKVTLLVIEHPVSTLAMPQEVVTTHLDAILTAEIGDRVSPTPSPLTFCRVSFDWFHSIFASYTVVLFEYELLLIWSQVTDIERYTYLEVVLVCVLQTVSLFLRIGRKSSHGKCQSAHAKKIRCLHVC